MQQLDLRSGGAPISAPVEQPGLNVSGRIAGAVLLASPLLLGLLLLISYLIVAGFNWAIWQSALAIISVLLLCYQLAIGSYRLMQIIRSILDTRRNVISRRLSSRFTLVDSPKIQPVSIIVWADNQSYNLAAMLKSLLSLNYPDYEVIVVNDGSTDNTLQVLEAEFGLQPINRVFRRVLATGPIGAIYTSPKYPILTVVDKPRAGRADSLNIGLNLAKAPLVCVIEPGYLLSREALILLAKPFIEQPVTTVMSAGLGETEAELGESASFGDNVRLSERKRLFHSSLVERNNFCMVSLTNNAVRLYRKADIQEIGGFLDYRADLLLCLRLQELLLKRGQRYRVSFVPDILCWQRDENPAPASASVYAEWQAGTFYGVASNIKMLFQPRLAGAYALLILNTISPLIELLGLVILPLALICGAITWAVVISYVMAFIAFAMIEGLSSVIADEVSLRYRHSLSEVINLIPASLVESMVNRPLSNLWRAQGAVTSLFKN